MPCLLDALISFGIRIRPGSGWISRLGRFAWPGGPDPHPEMQGRGTGAPSESGVGRASWLFVGFPGCILLGAARQGVP
eukprot:gene19635-biopygen16066